MTIGGSRPHPEGPGFGCVVVAGAILRAKHARDQARIAKAEAERNQL